MLPQLRWLTRPLATGGLVLAMTGALRLAARCLGRVEQAGRVPAARPARLPFGWVRGGYRGLPPPPDSPRTRAAQPSPPVAGP